ncbi:MAG: hypothetical protein QXH42_06435 [Thermoplasmata archaeon]
MGCGTTEHALLSCPGGLTGTGAECWAGRESELLIFWSGAGALGGAEAGGGAIHGGWLGSAEATAVARALFLFRKRKAQRRGRDWGAARWDGPATKRELRWCSGTVLAPFASFVVARFKKDVTC